jgi:hypothetical protein
VITYPAGRTRRLIAADRNGRKYATNRYASHENDNINNKCSQREHQKPSNNMPRNCGARNNKIGNWKMALHIGTWNVRTLFKTGSMNCIVREIERYKVKLVALQEIRWSDTDSINTNDTTILYGKCDNQRQFGTGFAVH